MRRYWVPQSSIYNDEVGFEGEIFHHIFDVCRQEKGSRFEVLTETSDAYLVEETLLADKAGSAEKLAPR